MSEKILVRGGGGQRIPGNNNGVCRSQAAAKNSP